MTASLAAWASTLSGAVSLSAASFVHLRYLRKAPSTWPVLKSMFAEPDPDPPTTAATAPAISAATRSAAFASGLLLSGLSLAESHFGQVGLGLGGDLHPFGEVLVVGGFLAGLGSQLARSCTLSDCLHAPLQRPMQLLPAATGLTAAAATAALGQYTTGRPYLYLDSAAALHSLDAMAVYDGSSMVAFTGAILAFVALKSQIAAKRSLKPIGVAFGTGAGLGLGMGLLNLCHADKVLSTLSASGNADPLLVLGLGASLLLNKIVSKRLVTETVMDPTTSISLIGSSLCGIGLGLTGLMPAPAMVGLASGSASFWLYSTSMLAGAGSLYLTRAVRSYYYAANIPAKSNPVNQ